MDLSCRHANRVGVSSQAVGKSKLNIYLYCNVCTCRLLPSQTQCHVQTRVEIFNSQPLAIGALKGTLNTIHVTYFIRTKRKLRCGKCSGCNVEDCSNCKDMKRFGGSRNKNEGRNCLGHNKTGITTGMFDINKLKLWSAFFQTQYRMCNMK